MRMRRKLLNLSVLVATLGLLLVATTPASGNTPVQVQTGTLDFVASDATGDGFTFTPDGGGAVLTETFTSGNQSRLIENAGGSDLTTLIPTGPGTGNRPYVGLKDHLIGVRAQGEGGGTPAVQINNTGSSAQTLTIELGPDVPGDYASYAQIAMKFKFGAKALVEAFDADGNSVVSDTFACAGSDCGADSGNDRGVIAIGNPDGSTPFVKVVISIVEPSDGAVSLLDEPGADPNDYDTFFTIFEEFDGELDCGENATFGDGLGEPQVDVTRQLQDDCVLKVYDLSSTANSPVYGNTQAFTFDPTGGGAGQAGATFFLTVTWVPETAANPVPVTTMDYNNDGVGDGPLVWCDGIDGSGTPILPSTGEPWCLIEQNTVLLADGTMQVTEDMYGTEDPSGFR